MGLKISFDVVLPFLVIATINVALYRIAAKNFLKLSMHKVCRMFFQSNDFLKEYFQRQLMLGYDFFSSIQEYMN